MGVSVVFDLLVFFCAVQLSKMYCNLFIAILFKVTSLCHKTLTFFFCELAIITEPLSQVTYCCYCALLFVCAVSVIG
jgi:hypothetical protein